MTASAQVVVVGGGPAGISAALAAASAGAGVGNQFKINSLPNIRP